jgi:hypothetical protein
MFVDLIKHKHGIGLFKQVLATWMLRSHVSNVSKQSYTYISCDDECNMMLMLVIWNANAMLNTRGVTTFKTTYQNVCIIGWIIGYSCRLSTTG